MSFSNHCLRLGLLGALGFLLSACDDPNVITGGQCPPPPAPFSAAPAPAMAGQSSVDVELSRTYLLNRVRTMLATDPTQDSGAFIGNISHRDVTDAAGKRRSQIELTLEPWLKGQNGQPASLQRFYKLTLQLTPRLVTPTTVTDVTVRRQLLQCDPATATDCDTRESALLSFDLVELYNTSFSRPACNTPDAIDSKLVPQIYDLLARQAPLQLPTVAIGTLLSSAAGTPVQLTDVNVSLDSLLKLGLQYNVGATHNFDTQTMLLSRFPNRDWLVDLDTSIMTAAVRSRMAAALTSAAPGATITTFSTSFIPGEISVTGSAALTVPGICGGTATLAIRARNPAQMCKDASNQSIIASWTDSSTNTSNF
ncbi:MAG: hypothetical protein HPY82_17745, partial [Gammaproteobacteria bacterium]|nr:hypothetical protein [Gammaproteobacteria bacterium]